MKNNLKRLVFQNKLPTLSYSAQYNAIENVNHIWFSCPAEEDITEYY